jgi:hypothetical protein
MSESPVELADDPEVDVPTGPTTEAEVAAAAPAEAAPAKGKRAKLPAGWGTPIEFAHALTARLQGEGTLKEGEVFKPQVVYSYIKNQGKANPFPVYYVTEDGMVKETDDDTTRPALKLDENGNFAEAMTWWDDKESRKVASAANKAAKADKKSATPAAPAPAANAQDEFAGDVVEAE